VWLFFLSIPQYGGLNLLVKLFAVLLYSVLALWADDSAIVGGIAAAY
jgi:hypothetical protein